MSNCGCGRPPGQCVKGDLDRCPALDEDDLSYDDEGVEDEMDCGRWDNGRLISQCRLAGTEWCDWDCPIGVPKTPRRKAPLLDRIDDEQSADRKGE